MTPTTGMPAWNGSTQTITPLPIDTVARLGTKKPGLAATTRESERVLNEIAESKGGNRQISARAAQDSLKEVVR